MLHSGNTKKLLFEKAVRSLIANAEDPLREMAQYMKDNYIEKNSMFQVIESLRKIAELKELLNLEEQKPLEKWDQLPLPIQ